MIFEIYIKVDNEYQRLDTLKNESVVINDSIQDVTDISKIFTAYTQQFNLPASSINNRIFKHYYNIDIIGGFDAREKLDAIIKVDGADYKKGKISLTGVSLKNNKPNTYRVVFYGNTVALKDLLGDDLLEQLDLTQYNHEYNGTNQITGLATSLFSGVIKYPLISHSRNFDIESPAFFTTKKVKIFGTNDNPLFSDFKPAIKLKAIIDAITVKYGLSFSDVFFNSDYFNELYLWLHRYQGAITNTDNDDEFNLSFGINDWNYLSGDVDLRPFTTGFASVVVIVGIPFYQIKQYNIFWTINIPSVTYTVRIIDGSTGNTLSESEATGAFVLPATLNTGITVKIWDNLIFEIDTPSTLGLTQSMAVSFQVDSTVYAVSNYDYTSSQTETVLRVSKQMPKMKVIDFMTNIFKMHNLTAEVSTDFEGNQTIEVEDLPYYYSEFNTYDITKYVDIEKTSVDRFFPYKRINFRYKGKETILTNALNKLKINEFGSLKYEEGDTANKDAKDYNIELALEKVYFERLLYTDTGGDSPIQWGYMVDKDAKPYLGKPLIFMMDNKATSNSLAIDNAGNTTNLSTYNAPVNNKTVNTVPYSLHFGIELDEFTRLEAQGNLFERYYKDYISRIYNQQARLLKADAYLPSQIILQYGLDDVFKINDRDWRISKIKTNLLTGKSSLELFNDLTELINLNNTINGFLAPPTGLIATVDNQTQITLNWDAYPDAIVLYNIYLNDSLFEDDIKLETTTITVSDTQFTYKIGLQATVGVAKELTPITTIFVTGIAAIPTGVLDFSDNNNTIFNSAILTTKI